MFTINLMMMHQVNLLVSQNKKFLKIRKSGDQDEWCSFKEEKARWNNSHATLYIKYEDLDKVVESYLKLNLLGMKENNLKYQNPDRHLIENYYSQSYPNIFKKKKQYSYHESCLYRPTTI